MLIKAFGIHGPQVLCVQMNFLTSQPSVIACNFQTRLYGNVMIVGPDTISNGPTSVRLKDIRDGTSPTIAIVELSDSGIHWAEPRDLQADEMSYCINDPDRPCIRSRHRGLANVAFCDGSVFTLRDALSPKLIKALTTIAGGEDVREFWGNY